MRPLGVVDVLPVICDRFDNPLQESSRKFTRSSDLAASGGQEARVDDVFAVEANGTGFRGPEAPVVQPRPS